MPQLEDGDIHITEHVPICKYIARKWNPDLLGKTDLDKTKVEQLLSYLGKQNWDFRMWTFKDSPKDDADKIALIKGEDAKFKLIDNILSTQQYAVGDYLTLVDIFLYENFEFIRLVHEATANEYPNIMALRKKIDETDWVKKFKASDKFIERPIVGWSAKWNN